VLGVEGESTEYDCGRYDSRMESGKAERSKELKPDVDSSNTIVTVRRGYRLSIGGWIDNSYDGGLLLRDVSGAIFGTRFKMTASSGLASKPGM